MGKADVARSAMSPQYTTIAPLISYSGNDLEDEDTDENGLYEDNDELKGKIKPLVSMKMNTWRATIMTKRRRKVGMTSPCSGLSRSYHTLLMVSMARILYSPTVISIVGACST